MRENGRKKTSGSSTADQVNDRRKRMKQKLFQTKSPIKQILSKKVSAQHNAEYLGLQVLSKLTSYIDRPSHPCCHLPELSGESLKFSW